MATIYRLVTELSADPRPMQAGFDRGIAITREFARTASAILSTPARNATGQFAKFGTEQAAEFLSGLERQFSSRTSELKEALARGAINRTQFNELGEESAKSFNTSLLNGISHLEATKGGISASVRESLVDGLKDAGISGSEAFTSGLTLIGGRLRSFGRDLTQLGRELSIGLTAPIIAGEIAVIAAAEGFDHAQDIIRTATAKTGEDLEHLSDSVHNIFGLLPNSAVEIGTALAKLSVLSGATGGQLEALATQELNLARITGTDVSANIEVVTHAFTAWHIAVERQTTALDVLFRTAQATGQTVGSLAGSVERFAQTLQQFGLSFDQSAALVGQLAKNGIEADGVLTALQTSLGRFAEKGFTGREALVLLVDSLKNAATDAQAIDLGDRIFGTRQGTQLALAIRQGKLDIQGLAEQVHASAETINGNAALTDRFSTHLILLRHAATEAGDAIGTSLEKVFIELAPTILKVVESVEDLAKWFSSLPGIIQTIITIALALAAGLGPLILIFGGIAKGIGATVLAIGLLRDAFSALAFGSVAAGATEAGAAMTGAAAGAETLVLGLKLLGSLTVVGLVVVAITQIIGLIKELKGETEATTDALAEFTRTAKNMTPVQITASTDDIEQRLARVRSLIPALAKDIKDHPVGALSSDNEIKSLADKVQTLKELRDQERLYSGELRALGAAEAGHAAKVEEDRKALVAYQSGVEAIIAAVSKGALTFNAKSLDPHGTREALLAARKELEAELAVPIANRPVPLDDAKVGDAIARLGHALDELDVKAKHTSLGSIFDKLSPDVTRAEHQIQGIISQLGEMPNAFQQLGSLRLNKTILDDIAELNRRLKPLGETANLDADKLRALKKELQGTLAGQIAGDHPGSKSFIEIEGRVTAVKFDPKAGINLLQKLGPLLQAVNDAGEAAAQAELDQKAAIASRDTTRIGHSAVELQAAYETVRKAVDAATEAIRRSGVTSVGAQAALKALNETLTKTGVNAKGVADVHIGIEPTDPQEAAKFLADLDASISRFGRKVAIEVVPIADRAAFTKVANDAADQVKAAQLFGLAGDTHRAALATLDSLDSVAAAAERLAKANKDKGEDAIAVTMEVIEKAAADAKISVQALIDELARLSEVGQRKEKIELTKLSGDAATASALQVSFTTDVARSIQDLARQALAGRKGAFQELQAELKQTGIAAADIIKQLEEMSRLGRAIRLADVLSGFASAVFGAQSGIARFASGFDSAIKGAEALRDAIKEVDAAQQAAAARGNQTQSGPGIASSEGASAAGFAGLLKGITAVGGIISGVVSAVGAVVGVIKGIASLFGESAIDREHDAVIKANSEALKTLTASLDRQAGTAGQAGDIIKAVGDQQAKLAKLQDDVNKAAAVPGATAVGTGALNNPAAAALQAAQDALAHAKSVGEFTKILAGYNLTLDQAVAAAKAFGITLLDSNKNINPQAMDDFMKAEAQAAANLTTLANDFQTTSNLLSIERKLTGKAATPKDTMDDSVTAITTALTNGGKRISKIADEIAAAAKDGPDALRQEYQRIVDRIKAGSLSLTDLGNFKDVNDFLNAIGSSADAVNAFTDAANKSAEAMVNVPAGFKKALEVFNATTGSATAPGSTTTTPPKPPPLPTDTVPTRPPDTGGALLDVVHALFDKIKAAPPVTLADLGSAPNLASKLLSDVSSTLGVKLPKAGDTATASMASLADALGIKGLAGAGRSASDVFKTLGSAGSTTTTMAGLATVLSSNRASADKATASILSLSASLGILADAAERVFHVKQPAATVADPTRTQPVAKLPDSVVLGSADRATLDHLLAAMSGGAERQGQGAAPQYNFHIAAINIDARDKPAAEIFTAMARETRRVARQITGDSTRVLDALQRG